MGGWDRWIEGQTDGQLRRSSGGETLFWVRMQVTVSVCALCHIESGQPSEGLSRELLAQELSLTQRDSTGSV